MNDPSDSYYQGMMAIIRTCETVLGPIPDTSGPWPARDRYPITTRLLSHWTWLAKKHTVGAVNALESLYNRAPWVLNDGPVP